MTQDTPHPDTQLILDLIYALQLRNSDSDVGDGLAALYQLAACALMGGTDAAVGDEAVFARAFVKKHDTSNLTTFKLGEAQ